MSGPIQVFMDGVKKKVCQHPEALGGEVWFTNKHVDDVEKEVKRLSALHWQPRVGTTAYGKSGGVVKNYVPIFISADARKDVSHECTGFCGHPENNKPEPEDA